MKTSNITKTVFILSMAVLLGFLPISQIQAQTGKDVRYSPLSLNLIIDTAVSAEACSWMQNHLLDGLLQNGDSITVWSAGEKAQILYSGTIKTAQDKENIKEDVKKTLNSLLNRPETAGKGNAADFSGALQDAASRKSGNAMVYTLLISTSPASLSAALSGPTAGLIRFSKVEEFKNWRVITVGLDMDSKVKKAAQAYLSGT